MANSLSAEWSASFLAMRLLKLPMTMPSSGAAQESICPECFAVLSQGTEQAVEVYASNPDFLWKAEYDEPRFGQGAFTECLGHS
eukprot:432016-Amphidinium_carterae.2